MFSSLIFKGILSQIIHAAYPIFFFRYYFALFLRRGFVSIHTWYCICVQFWHIENNLKTALARDLHAKGT